ncbi:MAG: hypothetical protein WCP28_02600 [Actinomycetes bacterium]
MGEDRRRLNGARVLAKFVARHDDDFEKNGHVAGSTIVLCLESDPVAAVMARIMREVPTPPATVAVYWDESAHLDVISIGPGEPDELNEDGMQGIGREAPIGMIVDHVRNLERRLTGLGKRESYTFRITSGLGSETQVARRFLIDA